MLTPLQENHRGLSLEKSSHYWPISADEPLKVGKEGGFIDALEVKFLSEQVFEHYELRELQITNLTTGVHKLVHHFHYQSWEDFGNPKTDADLVSFINLVNSKATDTNSPIVVHCSAGIGRTGTYIAVDSILNSSLPETLDPVFEAVSLMRQQRIGMVQSFCQFLYIYDQLKLKYTSR
jgi:protein-tyrosine phosphatase